MGNPRDMFRPDHQPSRTYFGQGESVGNQTIRREHARRQRHYNRDLIARELEDWHEGEEEPDRQGSSEPPP